MVVKLGGEIAGNPDALASLAEDVSLLTHLSIRVVVVHGGGPQATELSRRLGLEPTMVEGRRVTDAETLDVAKMVFRGKINTDILSALQAQGVRAVGLSGVDAGLIRCRRRAPVRMHDEDTGEPRTVDFGFVGDVESVDGGLLSLLMENGYVPVLASLGADAGGDILNINADTVASVVARDLAASKLISLTGVPGVLADREDEGSLVPVMTTAQARQAMSDGSVAAGMKPKLAALIEAVEGGVGRGHVLSGLAHGSILLELFTREGCGTLIVGEDDAPAAAADADAAAAADLLSQAAAKRVAASRHAGDRRQGLAGSTTP
jgi:acetylglutamate kinase